MLPKAPDNLGHVGKGYRHVFLHIPETLGVELAEGPSRLANTHHGLGFFRGQVAPASCSALSSNPGKISAD